MIPVFAGMLLLYSEERDWTRYGALAAFILAALSDLIDGTVARKLKQESEFGVRIDPVADKLLINAGFLILAFNESFHPAVPVWVAMAILGRDIFLVGFSALIVTFRGPGSVSPRVLGKVATTAQCVLLGLLLVNVPYAGLWITAVMLLTLASLLDYIYWGWQHQLRRKAA